MVTEIIRFFSHRFTICIGIAILLQISSSKCEFPNKDVIVKTVNGKINIGSNYNNKDLLLHGSANKNRNPNKDVVFGHNPIHRSSQFDKLLASQPLLRHNSGHVSNKLLQNHYNSNPVLSPNLYNWQFDSSNSMPTYSIPKQTYLEHHHNNGNQHKDVTSGDNKFNKILSARKYFLKKILGEIYDDEHDDDSFFSGDHLRRHGSVGTVAKLFGELIGLTIRDSIEKLGKSIGNYAKDMTENGFVTIGNTLMKTMKMN